MYGGFDVLVGLTSLTKCRKTAVFYHKLHEKYYKVRTNFPISYVCIVQGQVQITFFKCLQNMWVSSSLLGFGIF